MAELNKNFGGVGLLVSSFWEARRREDEKKTELQAIAILHKNCQLHTLLSNMAQAENG